VKLRTVGLLLALWCVLAIAPAVVLTFVMDVDTDDPAGYVVLTWVGGYLLQFGVFMVLAMKTQRTDKFLGWLIASLVPWAADWSAPVSPWWLLPCAALVIGYSWWLYRSVARGRSPHQPHAAAAHRTVRRRRAIRGKVQGPLHDR
jgi:hypothetical protein